jgi:hypothetical protein
MNIDKYLEDAVIAAANWTTGSALETANDLKPQPSSRVDWDEGAGESWARVIDKRRVVGMVSTKLPIVFIEKALDMRSIDVKSISVVQVCDMESIELSAQLSSLEQAFGESSRFHMLSSAGFSADDLWYATV